MSVAQAQARLVRVPFAAFLGMTLVDVAPGRAVLALPFQPAHANAAGPLNGGASASLLLMACTVAAWSLVPRRPGTRGATVGMHVSYTSTTTDPVVADAHVQQRSEEVFFSTVHVTSTRTGDLVALGEVTYRLLEPRDGSLLSPLPLREG